MPHIGSKPFPKNYDDADDAEEAGSNFALTLALATSLELFVKRPREALFWLPEVVNKDSGLVGRGVNPLGSIRLLPR
jgi:hypothetical protein